MTTNEKQALDKFHLKTSKTFLDFIYLVRLPKNRTISNLFKQFELLKR